MSNAIDRLEEMEANATVGPWVADSKYGGGVVRGGPIKVYVNGSSQDQVALAVGTEDGRERQDANAALISALRNASKPLLAVVRAGEAVDNAARNLASFNGSDATAEEMGSLETTLAVRLKALRLALATLKETTL